MTINSNSCFGCHLRCDINKAKRENTNAALQNDAEFHGLAIIVSKIYGLPMVCLLGVISFDHLVFSLDRMVVLLVLIVFLPLILFLASRSIDQKLITRGLKLE